MKRKNSYFLILFLLLFIWRWQSTKGLNLRPGEKIRVWGEIEDEPRVIGNNQYFKIRSIKVKTGRWPEWHFGDSLDLVGKIEVRPLNNFISDYWLVYPQIKVWQSNGEEKGDKPIKILILKRFSDLRRKILETYNKNLTEPLSSLLSGIVLGFKSQLSESFYGDLKRTGTIHVVVASGMNLAFLMPIWKNWLSGIFNRFLLVIISVVFLGFYCALVGFEPPIVRAAIMIFVAEIAVMFGRRKDVTKVFLLTGMLMLLGWPRLIFDLSWQLSFGATAGILFISPVLRRKADKSEEVREVEKDLGWGKEIKNFWTQDAVTTLAAQIAVWPILVMNFGEVSLISLLVNVLVLWTIPYLMGGGLILALSGLIFPRLASLIAWLCWPLLFYFVQTVNFFGRLPLASIQVPKIPFGVVIGYYLILGIIIYKKQFGRQEKLKAKN